MKNQHTPGPWRVVCASAHEFNPNTTRKDIIGKNLFGDAYVAGDIAANVLAALATGQIAAIKPDSNALKELRSAIAKAEGVK